MDGDPNGMQVEHLRNWLLAIDTLKKAGISAPPPHPAAIENAPQAANCAV